MLVQNSTIVSQKSLVQTPSLTYGEIDFCSFATILELVQPQIGEVFFDLGHGVGKSAIATALLYGHVIKLIVGVEIIKELYEVSITACGRYQNIITDTADNNVLQESHYNCKVKLALGDFMQSHFECVCEEESEYFDWTNAGRYLLWMNS